LDTLALTSQAIEFADPLEAIEYFYAQGWTDGLPVIPPTADRIAAFLEAGRRAPDEVIGRNRVRRRTVTAEKVAINAVMAGCLPEYAPVVFAAVEGILADGFFVHGPAASLAGAAILVIVNGPIARKLGFNSGAGALSPGWRANATVGRAMRLILINCLGSIPAVLDKSTHGHPGKFSYCIAENEEESLWPPLHVDRGLEAGDSAVTVFAAMAPYQFTEDFSSGEAAVDALAEAIVVLGRISSSYWTLMISPEQQISLARNGWDKLRLRAAIHEKTVRLYEERLASGKVKRTGLAGADYAGPFHPVLSPDHLLIVYAGGAAGPFTQVIPPWGSGRTSTPQTVKVRK
jgi:hypothetical protein